MCEDFAYTFVIILKIRKHDIRPLVPQDRFPEGARRDTHRHRSNTLPARDVFRGIPDDDGPCSGEWPSRRALRSMQGDWTQPVTVVVVISKGPEGEKAVEGIMPHLDGGPFRNVSREEAQGGSAVPHPGQQALHPGQGPAREVPVAEVILQVVEVTPVEGRDAPRTRLLAEVGQKIPGDSSVGGPPQIKGGTLGPEKVAGRPLQGLQSGPPGIDEGAVNITKDQETFHAP